MKIFVWGTGSMARAFAKGLSQSNALEFTLWNRTPQKAQDVATFLNAKALSALPMKIEADALILGFKPQNLDEACAQILPLLKPDTVIISLLAAVKLERLAKKFPDNPIIRVMPNLPVEKNIGLCLWKSTGLKASQRQQWSELLASLGKAFELEESHLDLYTLHAGCSPAFLYSWIDDSARWAESHGGSKDLAREIMVQAFKGTIASLEGDQTPLQDKISQVASRGGVTRAVLDQWATSNPNYISEGLESGLKRIKELSS